MKKLIYIAMMALTMGFMASCGSYSNTTTTAPEIDEQNATINGVHYDNEVYKCWLWKYWSKITYSGWAANEDNHNEEDSGEEYLWQTEFEAQRVKALWDYSTNFQAASWGAGVKVESKSSMTEQKDKNEESCYN